MYIYVSMYVYTYAYMHIVQMSHIITYFFMHALLQRSSTKRDWHPHHGGLWDDKSDKQ